MTDRSKFVDQRAVLYGSRRVVLRLNVGRLRRTGHGVIVGPDGADVCVHPPQEPPGYDLAKQHHSVWCDVCHRAIWYEDDPA